MQTQTATKVIEIAGKTGRGLTAEHFTRFISQLDASPKTVSIYARALKQLNKFFLSREITEPSREDIRSFRNYLLDNCRPNTVQLYITTARLFFQWLESEGLYFDITRGIKGAKISRLHSKDHLTSGQVLETLQTADSPRDKAILLLMVTAGLRCIEVTRANIEDIRNIGNSPVLFLQGKGRTERNEYVKLSAHTLKAILSYISTRDNPEGKEPLFTSEANRNAGGRMTTTSVSRIVKTSLRKAGYDSNRLTAHSLRHTTATLNLINGGTLQETQQLLRHASINTTLIYSHNLDRLNNNSEDRIDKAILGLDC